jgi:hypothetical protein
VGATHEEEEDGEGEAEEDRAREVRVVHDALVDAPERVQDRHRLCADVRKVDPQLCTARTSAPARARSHQRRTLEQRRLALEAARAERGPPAARRGDGAAVALGDRPARALEAGARAGAVELLRAGRRAVELQGRALRRAIEALAIRRLGLLVLPHRERGGGRVWWARAPGRLFRTFSPPPPPMVRGLTALIYARRSCVADSRKMSTSRSTSSAMAVA